MSLIKRICFILLLFESFSCNGQAFCFQSDSIVVNYLPWDLHTILALSPQEVRTFDRDFRRTEVIKETFKISQIGEIISSSESSNASQKEIDPRMVIDIYFYNCLAFTISVDSDGRYKLFQATFPRNLGLIKWINNYVVPFK